MHKFCIVSLKKIKIIEGFLCWKLHLYKLLKPTPFMCEEDGCAHTDFLAHELCFFLFRADRCHHGDARTGIVLLELLLVFIPWTYNVLLFHRLNYCYKRLIVFIIVYSNVKFEDQKSIPCILVIDCMKDKIITIKLNK